MVIGIDASRIENSNRTGVENYNFELIARLINSDKKNSYVLYSRKPSDIKLDENIKNKILKFPLFWTQIRLSIEMLLHMPDVFFIPGHTVPLIHPKNTVVIIHGLEYEYFPRSYSFWERFKNRIGTYFSARWAKVIVTPSENTKSDLVNLYKIKPEKIKVIYPGIPTIHHNGIQTEVGKPYILFIGRIEHRKNIIRIIKAFEKLKKDKKIPYQLVLAGKNGFGFEAIKKYVDCSEFKKEINLLGFVDESKKNNLLGTADVFVFPTLYEGFGFPILEAMRHGVPVVTSNIGSAKEIAGNAALLVDPRSIDQIADSVYKIINDNGLRKELVKQSYENIKRFNWDNCTAKVLEILNSMQ